jgi:hypothetical protein
MTDQGEVDENRRHIPKPGPPWTFARLASRIASWTTRALLSALILVVGLGFGREVVHWWGEEPPPSVDRPAPPAIGLGEPGRVHEVEAGDSPWSFAIESFHGPSDPAREQLRQRCLETALRSPMPNDPIGPAEQEFLRHLGTSQSVVAESAGCKLYDLNYGAPLMAVIRTVHGEPIWQSARRVVTWGLAAQASDDEWSLVTFHPTGREGKGVSEGSLSLPPECRRLLTVRVGEGGSLSTFVAPGRPEAWQARFDERFQADGWKAAFAWQADQPGWHRRFGRSAGARAELLDVHFTPSRDGELTGLVVRYPR